MRLLPLSLERHAMNFPTVVSLGHVTYVEQLLYIRVVVTGTIRYTIMSSGSFYRTVMTGLWQFTWPTQSCTPPRI